LMMMYFFYNVLYFLSAPNILKWKLHHKLLLLHLIGTAQQ